MIVDFHRFNPICESDRSSLILKWWAFVHDLFMRGFVAQINPVIVMVTAFELQSKTQFPSF